ncbi:MAG: ATP-binding protein [Planctomycetes bacterium]|nr:ATP-binding protein [Planctomycetota bacterium]
MATKHKLLPAQQSAADWLRKVLPERNLVFLAGRRGSGRTTVLDHVAHSRKPARLDGAGLLEGWRERNPAAVEEAFFEVVMQALEKHDEVYMDDFDVLLRFLGCGHFYPRKDWLQTPLHAIADYVRRTDKRLLMVSSSDIPEEFQDMGQVVGLRAFAPEDYRSFCTVHLGDAHASHIDFDRVHRFAPRLNLYHLETACHWVAKQPEVNSASFIEYLESHHLTGNVNISEVREVDFDELIGAEEVIEALQAHLVVPFENIELARELDLKRKRGVLLLGPPGTGKTTIGRALARRMHSKFFLIDGSIIAGSHTFYENIQRVVHAAKESAPSVIFIDDTDVIFENSRESGLYRYLLTLLDGIESDGSGRVCVVMTAMDVAQLPPALIRSGRIELWLELALPNPDARRKIIERDIENLPEALRPSGLPALVDATEGFTGADLRRVTEDVRHACAMDRAMGKEDRGADEYFQSAIESVRSNRARYEEAARRASQAARGPAMPM